MNVGMRLLALLAALRGIGIGLLTLKIDRRLLFTEFGIYLLVVEFGARLLVMADFSMSH